MKSRKILFLCLFLSLPFSLYAQLQSPNSQPDTTGLPDLVVNSKLLGDQWVVRDEQFDPTACSVVEGGITPGTRTIIRFTVETPNIGDADIIIGDPNVHVAANDGLFEFATCHHHYHFRHYAKYELVDPQTGFVWKAAKRGFCMLDTDPAPTLSGQPPKSPQFRTCGAVGIPGNQGISHGWSDTYRFFLSGQFFVLDGGDGQPPVPPGLYIIRITVNPGFKPAPGEPCRFLEKIDPADGQPICHQLPESDFTNNVGEALVNIPDHPGKSGVGPGSNTAAQEDKDEHGDPI